MRKEGIRSYLIMLIVFIILISIVMISIPRFTKDKESENYSESIQLSPDNYLIPGNGFTSFTAIPEGNGTSNLKGYNAKAIARWDVVPFQVFDGEFNVGVVAYHQNGIDKVSFSANGGPWLNVTNLSINPQTGAQEYFATLKASDFDDGLVEVRAIVYPKIGKVRVLQGLVPNTTSGEESLMLLSNHGHSLPKPVRYVSPNGNDLNDGLTIDNPKQNISEALFSIFSSDGDLDGATIYLLEGKHLITTTLWPKSGMHNTNQWVTITKAPDVRRDSVVVYSKSIPSWGSINKIRFKELNISLANGETLILGHGRLWFDNCSIDGGDRISSAGAIWPGSYYGDGKYATDSAIINMAQGTEFGGTIVRNVILDTYLSDAFSTTKLLINSVAKNQDSLGTGAHPDIGQYYGIYQNIIWQNVTATENIKDSQGFFSSNGEEGFFDIAVVDSKLGNYNWDIGRVLLIAGASNMYLKDSVFLGPTSLSGNYPDSMIENTTFNSFPGFPDGMRYKYYEDKPIPILPSIPSYPVSFFSFDESKFDSTKNENYLYSTQTTFTEGKYGKALNFPSASSARADAGGAIMGEFDNFTYSVWIKIDSGSTGNSRRIIGRDAYGNYVTGLYYDTSTYNNIRIKGVVDYDNNDAVSFSENFYPDNLADRWVHIALTYNSSENKARLFINGTETVYTQQTVGGGNRIVGGSFLIGNNGYNNGVLGGSIDEVIIYNRTLSPSEIFLLYDHPLVNESVYFYNETEQEPQNPPTDTTTPGSRKTSSGSSTGRIPNIDKNLTNGTIVQNLSSDINENNSNEIDDEENLSETNVSISSDDLTNKNNQSSKKLSTFIIIFFLSILTFVAFWLIIRLKSKLPKDQKIE